MLKYLAVGGLSTNARNTITQVKRLMGKKFSDPAVQKDLINFPFKVTEGPDGGCLINVDYLEKSAQFSPEQIMAAIFVDLREMAEKEQGGPVNEAVCSVPVFYTEPERHAMLAAAQVGGLNCLRLLDDTTATALAWGIYKTDLPENDPHHVVFVDVGYAATQVCVVAFKKGELQVLANAWDRSLGGRDFDAVLFDHFAEEFGERHKVDVRASPRSAYRLMRACERTKRVLTTNPEAPINVESLTPDIDANGMITRETFEEKAKPILDRLLVPVQKAMQDAGLEVDAIKTVEVVGGSTRVPSVLALLTQFFGREPSRTLNAKETVARGCALQCAMLSPTFKVREFQVQDTFPYGVQFSWEKDGDKQTSVVFERGSHVPSAKMLTFYRSEPFDIVAEYTDDSDLPSQEERSIGQWTIGPFKVPEGQKTKLKVKAVLNLNGIVALESVNAIEEEEVEVKVKQDSKPENDEDTAMKDQETGKEANAEAEAKEKGEADSQEETKPSVVKKTKTKKIPVPFTSNTGEVSKERIQALFEQEAEMALQARIQEETADARNAVESYVYSLRNRMSDSLRPFVPPEQYDQLAKTLDEAEEWLYDEGEDQAKSVYVAKLAEISALGSPIERRAQEAENRPAAASALRDRCQYYLNAVQDREKYGHLTEDELKRVTSEAEAAMVWLEEKEAAQQNQLPHQDPALTVEEIEKKSDTVARVADPILSKPPPKPEPKQEEKDVSNENEDKPMDVDAKEVAEDEEMAEPQKEETGN